MKISRFFRKSLTQFSCSTAADVSIVRRFIELRASHAYKLLGNKEGGKSCISLKGCVDGKNKRKLHYFDQWLVATKDLLHA